MYFASFSQWLGESVSVCSLSQGVITSQLIEMDPTDDLIGMSIEKFYFTCPHFLIKESGNRDKV